MLSNIDLQNQYIHIIDDIRKRVISAELFAEENRNIIFIESTTLQIRKILELIAYMSLLLNREKINSKGRDEYHAKRIIENISGKTKIFYPFPSIVIPPKEANSEQPVLIPIGYQSALSQKEFKEIYQECGEILHAQHPFKKQIDYEKIVIKNRSTLKKIKNLLQQHTIGVKHDIDKYTFLHVKIDFSSHDEIKEVYIKEYKTKIFSEETLINIFTEKS